MSSSAAQAYARVATTTASPRDIEAHALLKAANKLQAAVNSGEGRRERTFEALAFNRKLWTIFLNDALSDGNENSLEIRQNIANLGIFVLGQTTALQLSPQLEHFKPLIEINRNL